MDDIDNAKLVYNRSSGSWNPVGMVHFIGMME